MENLKKKPHFLPFLSWLTKGTRNYKASPEKHKYDLRWSKGTRNPYKCMNVIKQDAMDDKIIERCKTKKKWNACKGISINWGGVKNLSRKIQPQWIENLSMMYQADREHKILAQWIDLSVKKLSRSNPEISMDWDSVKICRDKKKERLDRRDFVEKLSSLKKRSFSKKGKIHRDECNKETN